MKTELDETKKRARESGVETESEADVPSDSENTLAQKIAEQEQKVFKANEKLISALEAAAADIGQMKARFSPFFNAYSQRLRTPQPQQKHPAGFQTDGGRPRKR